MRNLFILDVSKSLFLDIIRIIFALIDSIVYFFISVLFRAVFNLANFELIGFYEAFEERVYVILGIFMLFKVTISLITYLVNPDKISDKEQGAGKLITRIMTVLIMLIALPTFFNLMTELQNKLIPVIPRVIIGTANTLDNEQVGGIANNMALTMLQGFAHKKEECTNVNELSNILDLVVDINATCSDQNNTYAYDYFPVVSTLVGVLACYVVFSLCISVAIRAFKLIILRMMAPIPVISYIDPKSSKDGAFSHWSKTFISTWAELFIHLAMIYFIVYIIDFLLSGEAWKGFFDGLTSTGPLAFIDGIILLAFLIIGLLFFAKSAPQFVFDALGIKNKGAFTRMLGMGAAAIGGIGAARAAFHARQDYDAEHGGNSRLKSLRNAGASLFSGAASGIAGGNALLTTDKPNLMTGFNAQSKYNASMLDRLGVGSGLIGGISSAGRSLVTGETEMHRKENEWKREEEEIKALEDGIKKDSNVNSIRKQIMDRVGSKAATDLRVHGSYTTSSGQTVSGNAFEFKSAFTAAQSGVGVHKNAAGRDVFDFNGQEIDMAQAEVILKGLTDECEKDYYLQATTTRGFDGVIDNNVDLLHDAGATVATSFGNMKAEYGDNSTDISRRQNNVNERREALNADKASDDTKRSKANDSYFGNGSNK